MLEDYAHAATKAELSRAGITTAYHSDTPDRVVEQLEYARLNHLRVRLFYGDALTGRDWLEENDVTGTIGRSTGTVKFPLIIHSARSMGGPGILDHCIVKLMIGGRVVYQHPNYHMPRITVVHPIPSTEYCGEANLWAEGYSHGVDVDDARHANFKSEAKCLRYIAFLKGERGCK
jgi:hypothetical protein